MFQLNAAMKVTERISFAVESYVSVEAEGSQNVQPIS